MVNRVLILSDNPSEDVQNSQVAKCVTVNDRLSALGGYLIFKLLGWALIRTGRLFGPGRLLKFLRVITISVFLTLILR